jgi:class 3 adenylate cyclase/tetratricopeptide (TPR) repeat protein
MQDSEVEAIAAAMAALEAQRATLGDAVLELALSPLRARLAGLQRPASLQRRQVTVLFADVVGSTAMAGQLDAEDTLAVLSGTLRRMAAVVEAHQGRVLRFTGDGVKAAFGADEAREDDAERAVRAGLAILAAGHEQAGAARRLHGIADFSVRVGVHTGDVALGAGVEADSTAMGAAVNIAARMEQSAPPNALRISHDTWSHVRGLFEVEVQPPLQVKGVEAPMQTYLVHAALNRGFAGVERGLQGLSTPLVGRQSERRRLLEVIARARLTRQAQALTLVGDAGLGKSRLLRELMTDLRTDAPGHPLLAVRSQPDGALRPWGLLRNLMASQFDVADTDSAEVARRKVVEGLAPWFEERGERQAQLMGQLSGLDFGDSPHLRGLDPRSLRDQAFAALRTFLQGLGARSDRPPVLIVEDLHWADDGSLDLLQHLLAHAAELPLALVMTARPALLARRPDWGPPGTLLRLAPLAAAHSGELAQALLQHLDEVPAELSELIVGQAEGNPYYMEELVRRLVDDGVIQVGHATDGQRWVLHAERLHAVSLPGTLVGLLQARLDALPAGERLAARQASVIGHVFWDDALRAVDAGAPQALPALQRAAFVRPNPVSDFEGTAQRQFDHHLLHQVTYDTLLKAERRLGHAAAARWLTARTQGRGAEFLAMTGEHAERAGETALAVDCFEQAGKEAQKRFANSMAVSCIRRALGLLGESDPPRHFDLLDRLNNMADMVGERAAQEAAIHEMAALLDRHPDDARQASLCLSRALLADRRSDAAASQAHARQAFHLAERCGAAQTAALAQGQLAMLQRALEAPLRVIAHLEVGLAWAGRIEAEHARVHTEAQLMTLMAMASAQLCRFDEARETLSTVLARGESLALPRLQLVALATLAETSIRQGRWDEVAGWAERLRVLAHSAGAARSMADAQASLALVAEAQGDHDRAVEWNEQALATFRSIGNRRMEVPLLQRLGVCQLERGDAPGAKHWHAQARALCEALDDPLGACEAAAYGALCETRLGEPDAARSTVDRLLVRLSGEFAARPAHETIRLRWACQQTLAAMDDARSVPLLGQLHADVQARAAELTHADDRERLIEALPDFRGIVSAHCRCTRPNAAG